MSILQCETFQLVIWWKSCVLDIIATLTPASYCLQLWHNSGRMSRVLQSVSGVLCIWDTTCRAQYILFLGSFVAVSALSRSSNQNLDFFTWHVGFFVFFFYLARSIIVRVCVLREISIFYSLNFNILNLANCQTHRKICHDIASVIIMKKPCYEPDYRECVKASNRVVSLSRNTHTVDIDILICGTVCSKTLQSLRRVIKHIYKAHTHTLTCAKHTRAHTHTFISIHRQVEWQVGPLGLAIHGQWNSNITQSIF